VQYVVAAPFACWEKPCLPYPFLPLILILLGGVFLLLVVILVLILGIRRNPWWFPGAPRYYPVWLRRHIRYLKKRRI
jgi:hypothetical protein